MPAMKTLFKLFLFLAIVPVAFAGEFEGMNALSQAPDEVFSGKVLSAEVSFVGDAITHDFKGINRSVTGYISGNPRKPTETISAAIYIDPAEFDTGLGMRDSKMKKDVLETDKYPVVRLTVKSVSSIVEIPAELSITLIAEGNLLLHGVEKPVSFPVKGTLLSDDVVLATGSFTIDITPPGMLFITVKKDIKISFRASLRRERQF
jgi:polyisoprenoid-binding protein YceI